MLNGMEIDNPVTEFKVQHFLRGLKPLVSEYKTKEAMDIIVSLIGIVLKQWGYEISKAECFVIYQLKDLGKFRIKDDKLFTQLQAEWSNFKEYTMDSEEYKQSLKDLKNIKFIDLRRGAITFNPVVILR